MYAVLGHLGPVQLVPRLLYKLLRSVAPPPEQWPQVPFLVTVVAQNSPIHERNASVILVRIHNWLLRAVYNS